MTGAASPLKDHVRGTGQTRNAIRPTPLLAQWQFLDRTRGSIFRSRTRGPSDSRIVPVTAGYSWEPGAESRTPSNTCSKCELNPKLWVHMPHS
ncbi:hypothetical protein PIB30_085346 [Stylosanthes scabra]|uniref:Uncharacterized protein n=1 Tax=Stylosanthes scabra TaxID=79078 RepID=A0ABU6ZRH6_9FABA|nr:hypothetical protein [Stylosanthes scabra]